MDRQPLVAENALITCPHLTGRVGLVTSQGLVRSEGLRLLVRPDPEARPIAGCSNFNPVQGIKPCTLTLAVTSGYSDLVRIQGRPVCLANLTGYTDGTPPGTHRYGVRQPGQHLVSVSR
ncbi:hypothetical protein [Thiococcus pfennigii]|jgi:hypothetical protein|uniref:hypothetical protein n=1 Tax=Thiococcus pfennigii TaxID=1057 RepID=UPI001905C923|nr:hypothetical protein [Thiococcus pfennigii]MBK1730888.1 hypothetical protein [Thiococcus pfennigii]